MTIIDQDNPSPPAKASLLTHWIALTTTFNMVMGVAKESRLWWTTPFNILVVVWIVCMAFMPKGFPGVADVPILTLILPAISVVGIFATVYSMVVSWSGLAQEKFRDNEMMRLSAAGLILGMTGYMVTAMTGWTFNSWAKAFVLAGSISFVLAYHRLLAGLYRRAHGVLMMYRTAQA